MLHGKMPDVPLPTILGPPSGPTRLLLAFGNTFQKRSLSSPAPVTMELPSGFMARYRTRNVWPVNVAIFSMDGYFHTIT
jgi:hypothetical protein